MRRAGSARRPLRPWAGRAVLVLLAILARPAAAADVPAGLLGTWVVSAVLGAPPALWDVASGEELVGRTVSITPDRIAIFGRLSGRPVLLNETTGTLASVVSVPEDARHRFPGDDSVLRYDEVGIGGACLLDGKPQESCPVFLFATDDAAGTVSLVTYPWGMARLVHRQGAARPAAAKPS